MLEIVDVIKADPWLHYSGIVGIHNSNQEEELEKMLQNSNVISLIHKKNVDFSFPRVLKILSQNRQIIFQREIQSQLLTNISGSFTIDNDIFDVRTYAYLVSNYLYNTNFICQDAKEKLIVAIMELLVNAIEHGNCQISHDEKTQWLDEKKNIFELIRIKNKNSEINKKKVYLNYRITPQKSTFTIRDEGDGFDWQTWLTDINTKKSPFTSHGHGIKMTSFFVQNLTYNKKGNEVNFDIPHQENESNLLPEVFNGEDEIVFKNNQIVFKAGEESNHLFYIVSGKLKVEYNGKILSTLTPDDIFLGEMSFLLSNKRSATVRSVGKSVLLKISKKSFVNAIKQKPYYGLLLGRILAQRLARLNELV
jgi:anti-sigma regulatory factor (Ser/Thr protein kinase)